MIKIIKETYDQFPAINTDKTPLDFLLNRLIELHLIARARSLNTLTHRSFLKVLNYIIVNPSMDSYINVLQTEFKRDFTEKSKQIGLQYWTKIDPFQLKPFISTFSITDDINLEEYSSLILSLKQTFYDRILPKVRQLKSQNKGIEAVNYIIALDLQSHFDTKELIRMFISASRFKEAAALVVSDSVLQKVFP